MMHILLCFCAVSILSNGSCSDKSDIRSNLNQQQPTRPCPSSSLPCIRRYFVENSDYSPKELYRGIVDVLELNSISFYFPYINKTCIQYDMKISGLSSGKVQDFTVDTNTDLVVLTLSFKDLQFKAKTQMMDLRSYHEPIVIIADTIETYAAVTLTIVLTDAKNLNLDDSTTVAYIQDVPNYVLGAYYTESEDEEVRNLCRAFLEALKIVTKDAFLTRGGIISKYFIENVICDFPSNNDNSLPKNIENIDSIDYCINCDKGAIHNPLDNELVPLQDIDTTNYDYDIGDYDAFEYIRSTDIGDVDVDDYDFDDTVAYDYRDGSDCAFYDIPSVLI